MPASRSISSPNVAPAVSSLSTISDAIGPSRVARRRVNGVRQTLSAGAAETCLACGGDAASGGRVASFFCDAMISSSFVARGIGTADFAVVAPEAPGAATVGIRSGASARRTSDSAWLVLPEPPLASPCAFDTASAALPRSDGRKTVSFNAASAQGPVRALSAFGRGDEVGGVAFSGGPRMVSFKVALGGTTGEGAALPAFGCGDEASDVAFTGGPRMVSFKVASARAMGEDAALSAFGCGDEASEVAFSGRPNTVSFKAASGGGTGKGAERALSAFGRGNGASDVASMGGRSMVSFKVASGGATGKGAERALSAFGRGDEASEVASSGGRSMVSFKVGLGVATGKGAV